MVLEKKVAGIPILGLGAGALLLLLTVAVIVAGVVGFRGIAANRAAVSDLREALSANNMDTAGVRAELKTVSAEGQQLQDDLEQAVASQKERADKLDGTVAEQAQQDEDLQLQVLLLKASNEALKARIHLSEKDAGLAKRDLRECEATLQAAQAVAGEETQASLDELGSSIVELRDSIEAQTFPLTTLEILIDRIDALIGA